VGPEIIAVAELQRKDPQTPMPGAGVGIDDEVVEEAYDVAVLKLTMACDLRLHVVEDPALARGEYLRESGEEWAHDAQNNMEKW